MQGRYFEEFSPGETFTTRGRTVTEADIVAFAGLSGDYNPLHTDKEFARNSPFGERIAHGLLGLSIQSGLSQGLGITEGTTIAFLGLTWNFKGPILIGDTIHVVQGVQEMRETRKPDRGIVVFSVQVVNQKGEVVQEGSKTMMLRRKPAAAEPRP